MREITVAHRYLNLPVKNGVPKRLLRLMVDGALVREFEIELADSEPDFWVFVDIGAWMGSQLLIAGDDPERDAQALMAVTPSDTIIGAEDLYHERYRPQFHFTSRRGWHNDPNGLFYYRGEYHLFYQHNPYGVQWGNMHWGHAVSTDLLHWTELGDALYPDALGTIFSGSGVVDTPNTTGWGTPREKALVCIYTAAGGTLPASQGQPFTQCVAYSIDLGRTWHKAAENPVLGHIAGHNRDPKVIWHAPTQQWVMALYLDASRYALLTSPDIKRWTLHSELELPGCSECPDLFALPVDGDPAHTRWVFWGANGTYVLGDLDGATFTPTSALLRYDWGGDSYAAQTWSDIPPEDGRRIQIAWLRVNLPGMPFNQQMTFPCELTLRTTPDGIRLCSQPVREIAALRCAEHIWRDEKLTPGENLLAGLGGELFDIRAEIELGDAAQCGFLIRGIPVVYDARQRQLSCAGRNAPLAPIAGRVRLQILVDRASIEIFGNDGLIALPLGVIPDDADRTLSLFAVGGNARIKNLEVYPLQSVWP